MTEINCVYKWRNDDDDDDDDDEGQVQRVVRGGNEAAKEETGERWVRKEESIKLYTYEETGERWVRRRTTSTLPYTRNRLYLIS